ncbi:MAG TPA: beta-ketoacyl-ACP synthase II [Bacillota bacterium]|nr:beta-ketoacyl-ACP synthase II [Bacillota bacterium]
MQHRVVVTGMGAITPFGVGVPALWDGLREGRSAVGPLTRFDASEYPCRIAAEVPDFQPGDFLDARDARRMDRFAQFAIGAASLALADANLQPDALPAERSGVILGTGIGGMETLSDQFRELAERGPGRISPFFIPMMIANMAAGQLAIRYGMTGPNSTVVTACAAGANAIGEAYRVIQRGDADLMLTGGSEASLTPITLAGFCSMKALSTRNDEPARASRPFDAARDGFVFGEGAGVVVLESETHARARGGRIRAELVGYGMAADAYHIAAPPPDGRGGAMSMRRALLDAGIEPETVDYVNAHGTSTPSGDRGETLAIKAVFGEHARRLPVSSNKSMFGHLLGAAGAVEFIATVLALEHAVLPPTVNYEQPDPECDLDYVPNQARAARIRAAISNSFGFGGQNATLVVRRWEE